MIEYEAPGKINLSLLVGHLRPDGYHMLDSLVQTIDWCDRLTFRTGQSDDTLETSDPELDFGDNLILQAVRAVRARSGLSAVSVVLDKLLPVGAGVGGGSSDAAAALLAACELAGIPSERASEMTSELALGLGADVPLFLRGGTQRMSGVGEVLEPQGAIAGFAVALAIPSFRLSTADVYRKWDELGGPLGDEVPRAALPDSLRGRGPIRNDLMPAAVAVDGRLEDFTHDLSRVWGRTVSLTGSGSGCFAYFGSLDEANDAAESVSDICLVSNGVQLRDRGVARVD